MPPETQAVQSSHALIDYIMKHPEEAGAWHRDSNYLCQMSIPNGYELEMLAQKAESKGIKVLRFYEPDLGNELTAICLEPTDQARKLTSHLELMFKKKEVLQEAA